jgi:hypothetical protein
LEPRLHTSPLGLKFADRRVSVGVLGLFGWPGIARHALRHGWSEPIEVWCQPMLGGGSRGGWSTVRSIQTARGLLADLRAERWPDVLADLPTVAETAVSIGGRAPKL